MKALFFLLLLLIPAALHAQQEGHKPVGPDHRERMRAVDRAVFKPKESLMIPEFEAQKTDGSLFTSNQLRQRISLMMFFTPSCNCVLPQTLDSFRQFEKNPRFQMVWIMADSFMYRTFVKEHPIPGLHVNLNSHSKAGEISLGTGYPTFILVDGTAKALKFGRVSAKRVIDEQEFTARIREALLY
jgi:hypothetical protein